MKPLTNAVRSAHAEGRDWKKELLIFLLNYRATPHSTTGLPPSNLLLFNRLIETKLPQLKTENKSEKEVAVQEKDKKAKEKMKIYADKKRRAQSSEIKVGDMVLMKQRKHNKFSTRFDPVPFRVERRQGTMVTVTRNGKYVTRNTSLLKKVNCPTYMADGEEEENIDDDDPQPPTNGRPAGAAPVRRYPARNRHGFERFGQNIYDY